MDSLRVGVDIGGTFTDFVLQDYKTQKSYFLKISSTPSNPEMAVLSGLNQLIKEGYELLNLDTFFTSGPETITLPIKIYSMVRFSVTPEVNAASTVLIAVTILSVCTAIFLQKESLKKGSFE